MQNLNLVKSRIQQYYKILNNTAKYRGEWKKSIKPMVISQLEYIMENTELKAKLETQEEMINLESITLSLGVVASGIEQSINEQTTKSFIKSNGALVYQQLFNGKILIYISYPAIEGMSEIKPPKNIEILRPEELQSSFVIRHVEMLLKEVTEWEDYDDDLPQKIGFGSGFIKPSSVDDSNED